MTKDITFICDDNYCLPTAVCIRSVIDNYHGSLTIHVCTFELSEDNVKLLESLSTDEIHVVVDKFYKADYSDKTDKISQKSHVTPTALIKFELPNYFSTLDTILYLDSDIVVKGNIKELLDTDIENSYIAASYEFWDHINRLKYKLKRSVSTSFYFNSGVMLLNLKKMREDKVTEQLWYYKLNKAKTTLMDQESLNAVCSKTAVRLPIRWNFNPIFLNTSLLCEINKVYGCNYNDIMQLNEDARIIHYVGKPDKPWVYKNARMRDYWDNYYDKVFPKKELQLVVYERKKRKRYEAMIDIVRKFGFYGLICNVIYNLKNK